MEKSESKAILMLAPFTKVPMLQLPTSDYEKLRTDLSTYISYSGKLRERRKEIYEADRRGTLEDRQALMLSLEVDKWKRASDRMRLSVCDQLRALITNHLDASKSNPTKTSNSSDVIVKCTELWRSITISAVKEEIFEKERLLNNVRLHGKSCTYGMSEQQLESKQDDGFDVRDKLRVLIKFHDIIGKSMLKIRSEQNQRAAGCPRDLAMEEVEASQHLVICLRLIAIATTEEERNQEEQPPSVSYLLAKEILEMAGRSNQIAEEYNARCTHLQAQNRRLQEHDEMSSGLMLLFFIVAVYLYFR